MGLKQQVEILMNKLNIQLSESVSPADQIAPMESEPQSLLVQNTTASNITANKKPNTSSISLSDRKFNMEYKNVLLLKQDFSVYEIRPPKCFTRTVITQRLHKCQQY